MKDNILKMTDGEFHRVFDEIAKEYPSIEADHWIVDIGAAKLADTPEAFDVIVMPNLYGDILSDVAAQIAGSVGLAGSANIGLHGAMFEAIHGSAPRRAGQNLANPSGLLLAAVMMLQHVGLPDHAASIHNAWLRTLEEGIHTYDIFREGLSKEKVGTREFAEAIINNLGHKPSNFKPVHYEKQKPMIFKDLAHVTREKKELVGIDIFFDHQGDIDSLVSTLNSKKTPLKLTQIFNRGVRVYPDKMPETSVVESWRARFFDPARKPITSEAILKTLEEFKSMDIIKTENLYNFDGKPGYTVSQDEQ